jgi:hypothetical protein
MVDHVLNPVCFSFQKLEFTVASGEPHHVTRSLSVENIMDQLRELLSKKSADNEEVFDWIEVSPFRVKHFV